MASKNDTKPNILFILSDDQGPWAMHCAGNSELITPNLDRLANTGMRFSNFFCTSPVCSPARATLLTGRIPSQHGVLDWIADGDMGADNTIGWLSQEKIIEYLQGMPGYTDILAEHGWKCGLSGKWHLGDSRKPQKGFEYWYVHQCGGASYYGAPMIRDGKNVNEERYITDVITDEGIGYMEKTLEHDEPFYLGVHYTAPHAPWRNNNHPEEYLAMYDDCAFESVPDLPPHPWTSGGMERERFVEELKGYYASITAMDANIGRLIDWLEDNGLRENTLIIFTSDNGFCFGHHGIVGKGNGTRPVNMYEESVKVPAIFSQPGRIPMNVEMAALVSGYDFMPTLLDYVNLPNPEAEKLPGHSFKKLLLGESMDVRENLVVFDEYGPVRMIREKEWKYIHRYPNGPHELYDLVNDPNERINLINNNEMQEVVTSMKMNLEAWFVQYVDPSMDGTHEPVTGKGQIGLVGPAGKGKPSFKA
ncbi:sulfatase-like hydrolase/transferase [Paenibacillus sp. LMG 31458]|uniref:Sulfatase-like hydrolase/transferase n=1 Tax=Paenibacillus phytorum TaxID=2654977 RepID=A0ABX1Y4E5_9BACL|nr:sulfatase-like hydrolase/transferase [Paenibacillus phytorum]NOU75742.1 sulfatase-like hydrolase/transferase [Paenibacillus phytorum]